METAEAPVCTSTPARSNSVDRPSALEMPEATQPVQIEWGYLINIVLVHALSLLAFVPGIFSWWGLLLAFVCHHIHGLLGITLCYHRILTHQGLVIPKPLEHFFALLGVCCLQDTPARWVAVHRLHHRHSDRQPDPHSPLVNFFWAHVGWVLVHHRGHSRLNFFEQYARDILRDPFYFRLERKLAWFWVYWLHAVVYFVGGLIVGGLVTGTWTGALQWATIVLVWGVFVRTVLVWHVTWAVNSVTHLAGYRSYDTSDDSKNHWLVGLFAHGEGWHNNHHADQRAASHGHRWWEMDATWAVVRILEVVGLAKNVVRPRVWRQKMALADSHAPAGLSESFEPVEAFEAETSLRSVIPAESSPAPAPLSGAHPS